MAVGLLHRDAPRHGGGWTFRLVLGLAGLVVAVAGGVAVWSVYRTETKSQEARPAPQPAAPQRAAREDPRPQETSFVLEPAEAAREDPRPEETSFILEPAERHSIEKKLWAHLLKKAGHRGVDRPTPVVPKTRHQCGAQYRAAAKNPTRVYRLMAGHLAAAEQLLSAPEAARQRLGLGIAYQVTWTARRLKDAQFAAWVADVYLLPNVEVASAKPQDGMNREDVIGAAAVAYRAVGREDRWLAACRMRLAYASSPNSADASRYTLAQALAARGEYQNAIDQLRAMHSFERNTTANLMVSRLESKLRDAEVEAARRRVEAASPPKSAKDEEEP